MPVGKVEFEVMSLPFEGRRPVNSHTPMTPSADVNLFEVSNIDERRPGTHEPEDIP
jgi:hypothetical protein